MLIPNVASHQSFKIIYSIAVDKSTCHLFVFTLSRPHKKIATYSTHVQRFQGLCCKAVRGRAHWTENELCGGHAAFGWWFRTERRVCAGVAFRIKQNKLNILYCRAENSPISMQLYFVEGAKKSPGKMHEVRKFFRGPLWTVKTPLLLCHRRQEFNRSSLGNRPLNQLPENSRRSRLLIRGYTRGERQHRINVPSRSAGFPFGCNFGLIST